MSIESEKLMNLEDGKILYDDLRDRIEELPKYATTEETRLIILAYEEEEDEGMVVETVFVVNNENEVNVYFETETSASDIAAAFKSGKNVILHLPHNSDSELYGIKSDIYLNLCAYEDGYTINEDAYTYGFYFIDTSTVICTAGDGGANSLGNCNGVKVVDNKIRILVYVE